MTARPAGRPRNSPALAALALFALAAPGCEKQKDERSARADLEKARARISAAMDRIAAEQAAARVVVVIRSVGDRPEDVAKALSEARGLSMDDARAFLATPASAEFVAMSQPMAPDEAEPLRDALSGAGAAVSIEPFSPAGTPPGAPEPSSTRTTPSTESKP